MPGGRSHIEAMRRAKWRKQMAEEEPVFDDPQYYTGYKHDARKFVEEVLGLKYMDPGIHEGFQGSVLDAASDPDERFILLQAARGTGKSTTLSWLILWWLLSRPFSRVAVVTPSFERQAGRYLFPEVGKWKRLSPNFIPVNIRRKSIEVKGYEKNWFALSMQGQDAGRIEGMHADSILVIADEAKALDADVIDSLHGMQTSTSKDRLMIMASVPGGPDGPFYKAAKSKLWTKFKRSAHNSPFVSDEWIAERREEWGANSPMFKAHVMAEFPEEQEGILFPLSMIERSVERPVEEVEKWTDVVSIGVDPARYGPDRTAVSIWHGYELKDVKAVQGKDTMETAAWVHSIANRRGADRVAVDSIGIGAGVADRLPQLSKTYEVVPIDVRGRAERNNLFERHRAEMFWRLREEMERGRVRLDVSQEVQSELASIRYDYSPAGKIRIEKKDITKKRVGHSPDLADATALGFPALDAIRHGKGSKIVFSRPLGMGGV